ncbi:MAG: preprotein translocase subunit YajC [Pseudomonadota bacterium]
MLISKAYAQSIEPTVAVGADVATTMANTPSASEAFIWNMGLVALLVFMFYILLIRPQQKRIKEHTEMLQGLKKGDKVVTSGGLIGKISKIKEGDDEVQVDLGNDMTVTVLRSMLQERNRTAILKDKPANDGKADEKKSDKK